MDKLITYLKSCIMPNYLVPNQFVPRQRGCSILNVDVTQFDLNKALSLLPEDKKSSGVTVIGFPAGISDKGKPYNFSVFVGTPNAKDDSHIADAMSNV